jgi:hypothetical protein
MRHLKGVTLFLLACLAAGALLSELPPVANAYTEGQSLQARQVQALESIADELRRMRQDCQ